MSDELRTTRRDFLSRSLTLLGASATVPVFLARTVRALGAQPSRSRGHRVLVVVQLAGGNDGLNTVIPYTNDFYYKLRPRLALPAGSVHRLTSEIGLHSAADGLKTLFDDGLLAVVQGIGYPNPNRSHFKSMDVWHTASPDGRMHEGWIGRYFDNCCSGQDLKLGLALTGEPPLAMQGREFMPVTFERPEALSMRASNDQTLGQAMDKLNRPAPRTPARSENTLDFLRRTSLEARVSADEIQRAARAGSSDAEFPSNELGQSLRTVARLIAADLPTRVYFVSLGGFDTHSGQAGRHERLMRDLGASLAAFTQALRKQGDLERTLVMTFSEFGRRVAENASGGTDHGQAAPMFLIGSRLAPGVHGQMPSLEQLDQGDLAFNLDFRRVYATILRHWLDADAERILGGPFTPLPLLK